MCSEVVIVADVSWGGGVRAVRRSRGVELSDGGMRRHPCGRPNLKQALIGGALAASALFASVGGAQAVTTFVTEIDAGRAGVAGAGFEATSQVNTTNRGDAGNALGAPDQVGNSEGGFYSLGRSGAAVFGFGAAFDFRANVFEVTFNCSSGSGATCSGFAETVDSTRSPATTRPSMANSTSTT